MSGGLTRVAGSLVRPYFSNLSTVRPDELPTCTTLRANLRAGMAITHSPVALSAAKLKLLPLTTHATCGGSNSIIMCQDMVMTLACPLRDVASSTTGPGSSNW
jgi:hypothetical protein